MSMRLRTQLPELDGVTEWINSEPEMETASGPVLVYFWAVSCNVCHRVLPNLQLWRETYVPQGLKMISIHCPRMKTDTDIRKVKSAVDNLGIVEPCGVDNMHRVKKAFDNEFWPAFYIFDAEKRLKRRAAGNAGLDMINPVLEKFFSE